MKKNIRETIASGISLMGWLFALYCFIPVTVLHFQETQQSSASPGTEFVPNATISNSTSLGDDYYYIVGFDEQPTFREATISALMISIPLALDTLLDMLPPWVSTLLFAENRQLPVKNLGMSTFHLTVAEKFSFIIGMVCITTISFQPVRSYETPAVLYLAFLNANTILTTCPIIAFLTRCVPTWTPLRSAIIAFLICSSSLLSSFSNLLDPVSDFYSHFVLAINTVVTIAFGLFIALCAMSAVNTLWFQVPYLDELPVHQSAMNNHTSDSNSVQDAKRRATDRFRNVVTAAHMATTFVVAVVNPVWYFETGKVNSFDLTLIIYILIAASSIVYLTEFRVRKSEVTRALFDLLDAKKSYVRYISHELRTPMNAAFLGLKFVTDNMKENNATADPEAAEIYDTLCDVQTACSTAVNILNDLLTFEKLESGILELHKTEVCAKELISDCVNLFSAQAREKNIILFAELQLVTVDKLYVDKFKIDQVLRNLISNAIKFSPSGGTVSVIAAVDCSVHTAVTANPMAHQAESDVEADSTGLSGAATSLGNLIVKVIDEGAGISVENQKRLFNEMVQFNPEKLQAGGGSGFGLFICKGIVDLHEGKISVYSEGEGKGSTFTLELPIIRAPKSTPDLPNRGSEIEDISSSAIFRRFMINMRRNANRSGRRSLVAVAAESLRRLSRISTPSTRSRPEEVLESSVSVPNHEVERHLTYDDAGDESDLDTAATSNKRDKPSNKTGGSEERSWRLSRAMQNTRTHVVDERVVLLRTTVITNNKEPMTYCGGEEEHRARLTTQLPQQQEQQQQHGHPESWRDQDDVQISVKSLLESEQSQPCLDKGYEILVVDDSSMNRKMLIKILKAAGHVCEEAEDGVKAMEKVKQRMSLSSMSGEGKGKKEYYDAILMDFVMPNMDGPTATKALRKEGYNGIIFGVTGNGLESDIKHFESCGANKVLVKPFMLEEFHGLMKYLRTIQTNI